MRQLEVVDLVCFARSPDAKEKARRRSYRRAWRLDRSLGIAALGKISRMAMTRKRRRMLIATVVAAMLIGGWLWSKRPRVDQRVVGEWGVYTFDSDGTGTYLNLGTMGAYEHQILWWCEGDHLVIQSRTFDDNDESLSRVRRLYSKLIGKTEPPGFTSLWIKADGDSLILVQRIWDGSEVILHRRVH
jgi:hypothetical protein